MTKRIENPCLMYKENPGVVFTSVGNRFFLVSASCKVELNESAVYYWKRMSDWVSVNELFFGAVSRYEVEDETVLEKDIEMFICMCEERQLIMAKGGS